MERTLGWRHFEAVQKRGQGREAYVLLESTCNRDTKLWVSGCGGGSAVVGGLIAGGISFWLLAAATAAAHGWLQAACV